MLTIKEWRQARGISQKEMASRLGVDIRTYLKWENDPEKMPMGKVILFTAICNTDMNSIIFLSNDTTKCCTESV